MREFDICFANPDYEGFLPLEIIILLLHTLVWGVAPSIKPVSYGLDVLNLVCLQPPGHFDSFWGCVLKVEKA